MVFPTAPLLRRAFSDGDLAAPHAEKVHATEVAGKAIIVVRKTFLVLIPTCRADDVGVADDCGASKHGSELTTTFPGNIWAPGFVVGADRHALAPAIAAEGEGWKSRLLRSRRKAKGVWSCTKRVQEAVHATEARTTPFLKIFPSGCNTTELAFQDGTYVTLKLQKCGRGLPLLPVRSDPDRGWYFEVATEDGEDKKFPWYLQEFIARVCRPGVQVYDSMDGMQLVPYMAILSRSDYNRVWPIVEPIFREQRAAYRYFNGGKVAPEITATERLRFLGPVDKPLGQAAKMMNL